jgi:hypothetical protein
MTALALDYTTMPITRKQFKPAAPPPVPVYVSRNLRISTRPMVMFTLDGIGMYRRSNTSDRRLLLTFKSLDLCYYYIEILSLPKNMCKAM